MSPSEVKFRWLGVGGFEWLADGYCLLLDPFVSRPSLWQVVTGPLKPRTDLIERHLPNADGILVSHAHYDHLMDVPYLAKKTGAVIYGSPNAIALSRMSAVPSAQLQEIESHAIFTAGPLRIHLVPGEHVPLPGITSGPLPNSLHSPLRALDYRMDRCDSMLIEIGGRKWLVWHSIDTHDAPLADILVVGPEGGAEYFQRLIDRVKPKLLIPIHWDNFFRPLDKPPKTLPIRRFLAREFSLGRGALEKWERGHGHRPQVFSPLWLEQYTLKAVLDEAENLD